MQLRRLVVGLSLATMGYSAATAQTATAQNAAPRPETAAQKDARMAWWRDARFGMFIHWGALRGAGRHVARRARGRPRRMDHEAGADPRRRIRNAGEAVQPRAVRRRCVGEDGEGRRHEVHHHHVQAPRRLRELRLEGLVVRHRRRDALPQGRDQGARQRGAPGGAALRRLLLDHGLAPPGRAVGGVSGLQLGVVPQPQLRALRRDVHEAAAARAGDAVSRDRRALVRRRVGRRLERRAGAGSSTTGCTRCGRA